MPFLRKWISCTVAGLGLVALWLELGDSGLIPWFPPPVVFSLAGLSLLSGFIYPFIWHWREKQHPSGLAADRVNNIIRVSTALCLMIFGWKKILHLQFNVPGEILSRPMKEVNGEWLTWYYFGYSRTFVLILAAIQLAGGWFLLFRRTMLLSAVCLFAFMFNLLLVNIFYHMNLGALLQSVLITITIAYLILLHYRRLYAFFLGSGQRSSSRQQKPLMKYAWRMGLLAFAFLFVLYISRIS